MLWAKCSLSPRLAPHVANRGALSVCGLGRSSKDPAPPPREWGHSPIRERKNNDGKALRKNRTSKVAGQRGLLGLLMNRSPTSPPRVGSVTTAQVRRQAVPGHWAL